MVAGVALLGSLFFRDDTKQSTSLEGARVLAEGTTVPTTPMATGVGTGRRGGGLAPCPGFAQVGAVITSGDGTRCEVCLLAAETSPQRERGLMEVTDDSLGGYDGMVFIYDTPTPGAFWMKNTPLPLSIAYFGEDTRLISTVDMDPCLAGQTCPSYPASAEFIYALEVPQGKLESVGVRGAPGTVTLELIGRDCPEKSDRTGG